MIKLAKLIIFIALVVLALKGYETVSAQNVSEPIRNVTNCVHGDTLTQEVCNKFSDVIEPVVEQVQEFELPKVLPATGDGPVVGK